MPGQHLLDIGRLLPPFLRFKCSMIGLVMAWMAAATIGKSQSTNACFPIWNGFVQEWQYPHRMERMGDWVAVSGNLGECKARLSHAAAGGYGADQADFTQYYTWIQTSLVDFREGVTSLSLAGKEGMYIAVVAEEAVDFPPEKKDEGSEFEVLLNGFDLCAAQGAEADNVHALDMEIDSVWRTPSDSRLHFRVRAAVRLSCSSRECEMLNSVVEYNLRIHWIALKGQGFHSLRSTYGSSRSWGRADTAAPLPIPKVALLGDGHYPRACAGITGLHLQLDREQHLLGWESRIQPITYRDGLLTLGLRMDFWQSQPPPHPPSGQRNPARLRPSAHAPLHTKPGNMVWEMEVALLQFEDAEIDQRLHKGSLEWKASRKSRPAPTSQEAVHTVQVER
ncbi:MAG: hypothetical protein RLZZ165_363 [Bacteroidota bacterium]|jgi:hypothetical protein